MPLARHSSVRRMVSLKKRVAAVHHDIPRFQVGQQAVQRVIHRLAGFDHQQDLPRLFQQAAQLFQALGALQPFARVLRQISAVTCHVRLYTATRRPFSSQFSAKFPRP